MIQRQAMDIRRKIIAASTSEGWSAPHVAYIHEADVTGLLVRLAEINADAAPSKITLNTLLVYSVVCGIKSCPAVNAHIHYNKRSASGYVTRIDQIDVNMPVILQTGKMMTVKLSDFGNKTIREMQNCIDAMMEKIKNTAMDVPLMKLGVRETLRLLKKGNVIGPLCRFIALRIGGGRIKKQPHTDKKRYAALAKDKRINADDIDMGTITISNMGAALKNTKGFPALIDVVSPQVFAVGIGPLYDDTVLSEPADKKIDFSVRKKIGFCFVFDHRALDFGDIISFIKKINDVCAKPELYIEPDSKPA